MPVKGASNSVAKSIIKNPREWKRKIGHEPDGERGGTDYLIGKAPAPISKSSISYRSGPLYLKRGVKGSMEGGLLCEGERGP